MSASPVPSPVLMVRARSAILATRSSAMGPTATQDEIAMQRSPAEPNPALIIASAARSRSASGRITAWFFAPPQGLHPFPVRGGGGVDVLRDRGGSDEGHRFNCRVGQQCVDGGLVALKHVEHAGR